MTVSEFDSTHIDGGVLAGGLGTRFGGVDKGLVAWRDSVLIGPVVNQIRPYVRQFFISCNRNQDIYKEFSDAIVEDESPDYLGPLSGILALLDRSDADFMLISPCDTPMLGPDFAPRMLAALKAQLDSGTSAQKILLAASDGKRQHPLHLLLPVSIKESIRQQLAGGNRKMMDWLTLRLPQWVDFSDQAEYFSNVNSALELDQLMAQIQ
jgi:molybdopterin-guanine dinucleotide biosynthesis protein A